MVKEQEHHPADPPLVNPKEFLAKPFERLEMGELQEPPDIALLQWLPTLKEETGLVYRMSRWFVIKASRDGVQSWLMPIDSNTLLHSHPIDENEEENDGSIPSLEDYFNCSPKARNLIVSQKGITQYWPVAGEKNKRRLKNVLLYGWFKKRETKREYLEFLEEIEAKFRVYFWKELDEEKLSKLLNL